MTENSSNPPSGRMRGILAPLTIPDLRRLLGSNFLWWQTRFMEFIVVGWLVLELTDSAQQVAIIGFYRSAPFLIVGFLSGPVIDHFGRRKVIVAAQAINLFIYSSVAALLWLDRLALWHLAVTAFLMGMAWSLDWPARRSLVPDLVGRGKVVDVLLLENFGQNMSRIIGPTLAGWLIAVSGATGAYIALAAVSALTLLILLGLSNQPIPRKTLAVQSSPWGDIVEGLRYVRGNAPIMGTLLITVAMNFLVFPYMVLLSVFARDVLDQGPVGLGVLGSTAGLGAFVGLWLISRLRRYVSSGWIFIVGCCFQSLMILGFSFSTTYNLSLVLLFFSGIGQACFGIMQSSIILLSASDEMRSRAMGTLVLAIGAGPLGQLQIGGLAETFDAPWAVRLMSSTAALVIALIAILLPGLRQAGETTEERPKLASR